jgi:hypothetical protein
VRVDALAVRLRPRTSWEAADFGVRLAQEARRSVSACYVLAVIPVVVLAVLSFQVATWLPGVVIWWTKPWLDQSILFALSRAAFGQHTTSGDLWRARRHVWWRQIFFTLTMRRLSWWRSLTQPVYALEGLSIRRARTRVRQIRAGTTWTGLLMTHAFSVAEIVMTMALVSCAFWFAPSGSAPGLREVLAQEGGGWLALVMPLSSGVAVLFVEPFYVAAGFGMYLNRRVELEAWDVEQEFRHAFSK